MNWKKLILLLVVLMPSIFFLTKAFSSNAAKTEGSRLEITGAGGFEVAYADIDSLQLVDELPDLAGTGGFSLGWIKKGNFIRRADQKEIRVVKNDEGPFIFLVDGEFEAYFNLSAAAATQNLYNKIAGERN